MLETVIIHYKKKNGYRGKYSKKKKKKKKGSGNRLTWVFLGGVQQNNILCT